MIAPIRPPEPAPPESNSARQLARLLVACALVRNPQAGERGVPPLAAWKAWLIVAWLTLTAVIFVSHMAGLW